MTEELNEDYTVDRCTNCQELVNCRSQIVNGVGPCPSDVLLVGEAPGKTEDKTGEPFVGRSGSVLDEALESAGLNRNDIRITNCVRCRPPDNRDPHTEELENCLQYLQAEAAMVDPDVIVPLGRIPVKQVVSEKIDSLTGNVGEFAETDLGNNNTKAIISVHPAATLYNRDLRPQFDTVFEQVSEIVSGSQE
jgi:uracil-DNA glycosylase family 4